MKPETTNRNESAPFQTLSQHRSQSARRRIPVSVFLVLIASLNTASTAPAIHVWTGGTSNWGGTGDWFDPANWLGPGSVDPGPPSNDLESAEINHGGTAQITRPGAVAWAVTLGYPGNYPGGTGSLDVNGGQLSADILVGDSSSGTGTLTIRNGGQVNHTTRPGNGSSYVNNGTVTVDGGTWYAGFVNMGFTESENGASVNIRNGGRIFSGGTIGDQPGSTGFLSVDGSGSSWSGNELVVGDQGNGGVVVTNGGLLSSSVITLARQTGSFGALYVGPPLFGTSAPGPISANTIIGGAGTAQVRFHHNGASYSFTPVLQGNLEVFHNGSGTTILPFHAHTYTGNTSVAQGTLRVALSEFSDFPASITSPAAEVRVGTIGNLAGTLEIADGGDVTSALGCIGCEPASTGTVTVIGPGSTWTNSDLLYVGWRSGTQNHLNVQNGGVVASSSGRIGWEAGAFGRVTVGDGSGWNTGRISVGNLGAGVLNVTGSGIVDAASGVYVAAGSSVLGNGTIAGNVSSDGTIDPGAGSPGTLHIRGDYRQSQSGALIIDVSASGHDTLAINHGDTLAEPGNVWLAGTLRLELPSFFPVWFPSFGYTFDVLDWSGTLSGAFDDLQLPRLPSARRWNTSQLYTTGVISIDVLPSGDYNKNGVVDAADYVVWRNTFGQSGLGLDADGDGDRLVDADDYALWRAHFGETFGSGATSDALDVSVPEPTSAMSLLIAFAGLAASLRSHTTTRICPSRVQV